MEVEVLDWVDVSRSLVVLVPVAILVLVLVLRLPAAAFPELVALEMLDEGTESSVVLSPTGIPGRLE